MNDIDVGVAFMFLWSLAIFIGVVVVISVFTVFWKRVWNDDKE